jgi:hypothetical protein
MSDVASSAVRRGSAPAGPPPIRPRTIVLLAGGLHSKSLSSEIGRSVLDLPITAALRLLGVWRTRLREVGDPVPGVAAPPVRILVAASSAAPVGIADGESRVRVEGDATAYRGTAGAVRDLCEGYGPDDHVLVGTASQCPERDQVRSLLERADPADGVTLSAGPDGEPTGLVLLRCAVLAAVPAVGYVDLKEQALPRIARSSRVRVVPTVGAPARPLRDVRRYLDAVRSWHRFGTLERSAAPAAFEERWKPAFAVVEEGARVAPGARLYDSVVLAGGVVERDAEVVRCVVGPGGLVRRRERATGRLVLPARRGAEPPQGEAGGVA